MVFVKVFLLLQDPPLLYLLVFIVYRIMFVETQIGDRVTLRQPSHQKDILKSLSAFRKGGTLCDVTLLVEGKKFLAHKSVLASCTEYFKAMFSGSMVESRQAEICLETISCEVFDQLLDFMYDGCLSMDMLSVVDMLHASSLLLLKDVETECFQYLKRNINLTNCIRVRGIAEAYSNRELITKCNDYIRKNFEKLVKEKEIMNLSFQDFKTLLTNDELVCRTEDLVANLVENWLTIRNNFELNNIRTLLKTIRFPFLTQDGLQVLSNAMKELDKKKSSSDYSKAFSSEQKLQTRNIRRQSIKCRTSQQNEHVVLCLGRRGETYCYHVHNKKFCQLSRYPELRQPGELTVHDNIVYATGGSHLLSMFRASYSNVLYSYDPSIGVWSSLPPMSNARCKHCAVFLRDKLYVIGGRNLESTIANLERSVECYDPSSKTWTHVTSTMEGRVNSSAAASSKFIYVIGGENNAGGIRGLSTVERYCPRKETWERMPNLTNQRIGSSAVFFNEKIFVFGGGNGIFELNNFEFLEVNEKKWTLVTIPYSTHINTALSMQDTILALGTTTWGDDLVLQYSCVRRRGAQWKQIRDFIHPNHRTRSMKYAVIKMLNYDIDNKMEVQCDCNYYDADSSTLDDDLMSTSSDFNSDDAGWLDLDPWGVWV